MPLSKIKTKILKRRTKIPSWVWEDLRIPVWCVIYNTVIKRLNWLNITLNLYIFTALYILISSVWNSDVGGGSGLSVYTPTVKIWCFIKILIFGKNFYLNEFKGKVRIIKPLWYMPGFDFMIFPILTHYKLYKHCIITLLYLLRPIFSISAASSKDKVLSTDIGIISIKTI